MAHSRRSSHQQVPSWLYKLSFLSVMLLALALAVAGIFGFIESLKIVAYWIEKVALLFAVIVPCFMSYYHARVKTKGWYYLWIAAVIIVAVCYVLVLVGAII